MDAAYARPAARKGIDMTDVRKMHPATRIIHAGQHPDPATGAVSTPIYQTSTFAFKNADEGAARFQGRDPGYKYTRLGNPTVAALEECLATLEGGCGALGAATGMAAINTVYVALLEQGAHVVGTDSVYGPSRLVLENEYRRFGVASTWVDSSKPENVAAAMRPSTKMVYVESPANPTMKLTDLAACADIAHAHGALLVVDNTFASPVLQQPLALGADVVVHSLTKYINGHTDVVGGAIVVGLARAPRRGSGRSTAPSAGRWTRTRRGSSCAASRRSASGWSARRRTRSRSRASSRRTPASRGCSTPASRATPSSSSRSGRCPAPAPSSPSA